MVALRLSVGELERGDGRREDRRDGEVGDGEAVSDQVAVGL